MDAQGRIYLPYLQNWSHVRGGVTRGGKILGVLCDVMWSFQAGCGLERQLEVILRKKGTDYLQSNVSLMMICCYE